MRRSFGVHEPGNPPASTSPVDKFDRQPGLAGSALPDYRRNTEQARIILPPSKDRQFGSPSDERQEPAHTLEFHYEGGIVSFVTHLNKNKVVVNDKPIYMRGDKDRIDVEIAVQWNDTFAESVFCFANNINTHDGGTHLSGFRAALTRTLNSYATKNNLAKDLKESVSGEDIREGLTAVISVKIPQPQFEGQTKTKLGNTEVKGIVETAVSEKLAQFFEENPPIAKKVLEKAVLAAKAREAARKAQWQEQQPRRDR